MTWTLTVTDHGRWAYLERMLASVDEAVGLDFFDVKVAGFDGIHPPDHLGRVFDDFRVTPERRGLAVNLSQTWSMVPDDCWVFHVESDFLIHDAPLEEMAKTLDAYRNVANMVLVRQPWGPHEIHAGSVLAAQNYDLNDRGGWIEHVGGYWLNPHVVHSSLLRSLHGAVETDLTNQCRSRGLTFGWWGGVNDPPRVEHLGSEGGMGSPGWLP